MRFAWLELQCCAFAGAVFLGLAVSRVVPLPVARYDALLGYAVVLTVVFYVVRLETRREVAVILAFHLIGLALELFKVRVGSWAYPEDAWSKVGACPCTPGSCTPPSAPTSARPSAASTCAWTASRGSPP